MPFVALYHAVAASLLVLLLSGCQALGTDGLVASKAPASIAGQSADAIANDMVGRLSEQIGPGTATVALKQDGSPFGQALAAALQGRGYAVVTDQATGEKVQLMSLAYVIDPFEGQILARLSTNDLEIARAYSVTATGASPASPLSVMRRG
ncbi:conjugal transfer protein TrbH [Mesorhizobium sp. CGMCC 1.15528]|uniref:Conjugal transfer protein TrbH n=1 Tax=Mesorhizobium zhangyense TaxID=1776730 RepID=A0A7C9RCU3_9HYPH|nr:conjugal transfer protein TrbH [Mesorhizobium zhangyense]NGN43533.1 conjugal transfer protein TrbH [Mesorhizobium zhangyense]